MTQTSSNISNSTLLPAKAIGTISAISGSKASVLLVAPADAGAAVQDKGPFIGTLLTVDTTTAVVLCLITSLKVPDNSLDDKTARTRVAEVELVGELKRESDGYLRTFTRGVSVYPRLGDDVLEASRTVLEKAYHFGSFSAIEIGNIRQDPTIPAALKVDEMLSKHFAIVGSTGSGKSCTVALVLRTVLASHPNAHMVMLDPHNEYGDCFGDATELINPGNLNLPFWILTFEEIVEILIGNGEAHPDEVDILRDFIPVAKRMFAASQEGAQKTARQPGNGRRSKFTVDVPVPYRMSDLIGLIDAETGRLEMQKDLRPFKKLRARIDSIRRDPRYNFMFANLTLQDDFALLLKRLFRIPVDGKAITVVQLMGLPSEIVNVVVSVLARMAFDLALWSDGRMPVTFVCEEAHRYVPCERCGFRARPEKRRQAGWIALLSGLSLYLLYADARRRRPGHQGVPVFLAAGYEKKPRA